MTDKERNSAPNLILLCLEHHTVIDGQAADYPVELLQRMKSEHEAWVDEELTKATISVTFVELEAVTTALLASIGRVVDDLRLTPPAEKMAKNELGPGAHHLITLGLVNVQAVSRYITGVDAVDTTFSERLSGGFQAEYLRLRGLGLRGDDLFAALMDFANGGTAEFLRQAAGLSVLSYLFESCEVFEK
jgi:hypothetical protein